MAEYGRWQWDDFGSCPFEVVYLVEVSRAVPVMPASDAELEDARASLLKTFVRMGDEGESRFLGEDGRLAPARVRAYCRESITWRVLTQRGIRARQHALDAEFGDAGDGGEGLSGHELIGEREPCHLEQLEAERLERDDRVHEASRRRVVTWIGARPEVEAFILTARMKRPARDLAQPLSFAEIRRQLASGTLATDLSDAAVRQRASRGMKAMRAALGDAIVAEVMAGHKAKGIGA